MNIAGAVFTIAALASIAPATAATTPTTVCAANVQYPPFFYFAPVQDGVLPAKGLANDILREAFGPHADAFEISKLPWKRCLKLAELGLIDIVINVPTAQIDPAPYFVSEPYVELQSAYYVSRRHWPKGIRIKNLEDLKTYRICGLSGNTYDGYGLRDYPVDGGANNYMSLIGKLHANHCDLFIEKRAVVAGLKLVEPAISAAFSSRDLHVRTLPEDSLTGLHFAISKRSPQAAELRVKLNETIIRLNRAGSIDKWVEGYLTKNGARRIRSSGVFEQVRHGTVE
jgi:polar amino acid transport system substrate-binding protein